MSRRVEEAGFWAADELTSNRPTGESFSHKATSSESSADSGGEPFVSSAITAVQAMIKMRSRQSAFIVPMILRKDSERRLLQ